MHVALWCTCVTLPSMASPTTTIVTAAHLEPCTCSRGMLRGGSCSSFRRRAHSTAGWLHVLYLEPLQACCASSACRNTQYPCRP